VTKAFEIAGKMAGTRRGTRVGRMFNSTDSNISQDEAILSHAEDLMLAYLKSENVF
jgi:hypothetical protein